MIRKSFLAAGVFALASVPMAYGTSYEVAFANPVQAGTAELSPGTYTVSHKRDEAIFTNLNNGEVYKTTATVKRTYEKNNSDQVTIQDNNGQAQIQTIALGGRMVDLEFNY